MKKQSRSPIQQQFFWPALLIHIYALLLGATYLLSGLLNQPALLFGPLALCGLLGAIVIGITQSTSTAANGRLVDGLRWGSIWILLCILPFAARWAWLRFEASRVPYPADWEATISVDPILFNEKPDFVVRHESDHTIPETVRETFEFYSQRGYSAGFDAPQPYYLASDRPVASRPGYGVTFNFERDHKHVFVMIWAEKPEGSRTIVYIFESGDTATSSR